MLNTELSTVLISDSWAFGTQFQFQSPNCLKSELQVSTAKLSKDIKYVLSCTISPSFYCLNIGLLLILEIFLVRIFLHFFFQPAIKKYLKKMYKLVLFLLSQLSTFQGKQFSASFKSLFVLLFTFFSTRKQLMYYLHSLLVFFEAVQLSEVDK